MVGTLILMYVVVLVVAVVLFGLSSRAPEWVWRVMFYFSMVGLVYAAMISFADGRYYVAAIMVATLIVLVGRMRRGW